ncbi:helix-turn-helix transcriptional regulator [Sedimenticola selenatireducens]|uniref:Helix-turn-helix transcriptional regulator n=1 Tax=Sedimenticola selenatireducens TaxID=191960 RepID=A0A557RV26_9GAMM|nr:helix-turn-helix transcriptional regulator [Sedimenticola selenatireducens]TVT60902.1 MAG: helix-turn-helix transcriptional regulator [Sedimenticola selenatireducens]
MSLIDPLKDAEKGLGERLRQTRLSAGLTQQQLADLARANQAVIQKIENGKSLRRMQNGTSKSPFCTRSLTDSYCPDRPSYQHYATTSQARYCSGAVSRRDRASCS